MAVIVIQSHGASAGGGDVTPSAMNWGDISVTDTVHGLEDNSATQQTVAGLSAATSIQLKCAWTSSSGHPAHGYWVKNGVQVSSAAATPVFVNCANGDVLFFAVYCAYTYPSGNYDTGTATVTNVTDSNASVDTFAFACQFVPSGTPPNGGTGGGHYPPNPNVD